MELVGGRFKTKVVHAKSTKTSYGAGPSLGNSVILTRF